MDALLLLRRNAGPSGTVLEFEPLFRDFGLISFTGNWETPDTDFKTTGGGLNLEILASDLEDFSFEVSDLEDVFSSTVDFSSSRRITLTSRSSFSVFSARIFSENIRKV